ncbi:MAG: energy transducer TonB [Bacteroidetes bacterium]|nr:energy transducer TonB [Bacteroidota bacterium]
MNLKTSLVIAAFFIGHQAFAQIEQDTAVAVDSIASDYEPPIMIEEYDGDYYDMPYATPAPDIESSGTYPAAIYFNRFMFKSLGNTVVNKPDQAARYPSGIKAMNAEIQLNLRTPYMYSDEAKFVIIEVTVGVDSLLYNPQVVYSSGYSYDEKAKAAIEQLSLRFIPGKKNGKDVPSTILIPIRFERRNTYDY